MSRHGFSSKRTRSVEHVNGDSVVCRSSPRLVPWLLLLLLLEGPAGKRWFQFQFFVLLLLLLAALILSPRSQFVGTGSCPSPPDSLGSLAAWHIIRTRVRASPMHKVGGKGEIPVRVSPPGFRTHQMAGIVRFACPYPSRTSLC